MCFNVENRIWESFPGMLLVVAHGQGLDNKTARPSVTAALREAEGRVRAGWTHPNAQSHPFIAAWRNNMKRLGISASNFPSSIESLCRQALSGRSLSQINPLVDFYNAISLEHLTPVGGWDVSDGRKIWLRFSRTGEAFTELGKSEPVNISEGEVCYADPVHILTRHFVWRQSEYAKITPESKEFFLVSEILPELGREVAHQVEAAFARGLLEHFGVFTQTAILDSNNSIWSFLRDDVACIYY